MRHNGKYEIDGKLNNHGPALVQTASRRYLSLYTPRVLLVALVTAGVNFIDARTPISGDIGGKTFTADDGPYIVEKDLTIPEGKEAVVKEGCHFFFKPFTGIIIYGNFTATGTQERHILFSSINDSLSPYGKTLPPNPFDWNGIHITSKAGNVLLSHFTIAYSTYGIQSKKESFAVYDGIFRRNGQYNCTVNNSIKNAAEGVPFTYAAHAVVFDVNGATSGGFSSDTIFSNEGAIIKVPDIDGGLSKQGFTFAGWNSSADGDGKDYGAGSAFVMGATDVRLFAKWAAAGRRKADSPKTHAVPGSNSLAGMGVPIAFGGAGVVSGIVSLVLLKNWTDGKEEYETVTSTTKRRKLDDRGKAFSATAITTGALSAAAITTGAIIFFRNNTLSKKISVSPVLLHGAAGAEISILLQ